MEEQKWITFINPGSIINYFQKSIEDIAFEHDYDILGKSDYQSLLNQIIEMKKRSEEIYVSITSSYYNKVITGRLKQKGYEYRTQLTVNGSKALKLVIEPRMYNINLKTIDDEVSYPRQKKISYTDKPCTTCGTRLYVLIESQQCLPCMNHQNHKNDDGDKLDLGNGIILKGQDKDRRLAFYKREDIKAQEVKDKKRFFCTACKKYVKEEHRSKNQNNKNICTRCAKFYLDLNEDKKYENNKETARKLKETNKNRSVEQKKDKAQSEQDMITAFLNK